MNNTKYIYHMDIKSGSPILHYFLYKKKHQLIGFTQICSTEQLTGQSQDQLSIPHGGATFI